MIYPNPQNKTEFLAAVEGWLNGEAYTDIDRMDLIDWFNENVEAYMPWEEWEPTLMALTLA